VIRIARWCFRHRLAVIAIWSVLLVASAVSDRRLGTSYASDFSLPGSASTRAIELLSSGGLGAEAGDDTIVLRSSGEALADPATQGRINGVLGEIAELPGISAVRGPFAPGARGQVSPDGRTAFARVSFAQPDQDLAAADINPLVTAASALRSADIDVEFGGLAFQSLKGSPTSGSELVGIVIAAVVLLLAFGSLGAASLPLLAALFAVGLGIEITGLLSHVLSVNALAPTVAALIGLGVAIDYALFVVSRYRRALVDGLAPIDATILAVGTSGRAVVFAGGTVAIALLGLLVLGIGFLTGIAVACSIVVVLSVAASITLLPALFSLLGNRLLRRSERRRLAASGEAVPAASTGSARASGRWDRWAWTVQRHPLALGLVALAFMVILAIPSLTIRLGSSDQGNDPAGSTTRRAYDLLTSGFGPGFTGPLVLVARTPLPADQAALVQLTGSIRELPGVAAVSAARAIGDGTVEVVQVIPATSPQSAQTSTLIDALLSELIPAAERGTGLEVFVGGQTAIFQDFATAIAGKLGLFVGLVVLLGCLLLLIAFRSLPVALLAGAMNLLAAGAAIGIVVVVFQWGWGSEALGLGAPGPVEAFLPVMLVAILFGLSMDYQVFLVSRMHEAWLETGDHAMAIRTGQAETGRVITAAAAIMVAVFLAFVFGGRRPIGEFGLGLAMAILIDALIVRTILVPATMHLMGRSSWALPNGLARVLPKLNVDGKAI
jgi:putative drug exporter of the RND superfamily